MIPSAPAARASMGESGSHYSCRQGPYVLHLPTWVVMGQLERRVAVGISPERGQRIRGRPIESGQQPFGWRAYCYRFTYGRHFLSL